VELREPDPGDADPPAIDPPAIDPPADVPQESAEPEGRRYPSTVGGALYLLVLVVSAGGLVVMGESWRIGIRMIAGALLFAAGARLLLPARDAGMLAVRRRPIDVAILAVLGAVMLVLSLSIPDQPPL
jgi:Protein of unknown function (DUF3017)